MDRHLEGQAGQWVLHTPSVRRLILKAYDGSATDFDIEIFHRALTQRFKLTVEEAWAMEKSRPHFDLLHMKQGASEDLEQYYNRTLAVLIALHDSDGNKGTLTSLEVLLFWTAVERFVAGLSSRLLRLRLLEQQILHHARIPHKVYNMVKAEIKTMDLKAKIKAAKEKAKELKKKRTLATDEEEQQDNAKKQKKSLLLKLKLPTPTQNDEPRSRSDVGGRSLNLRDDDREATYTVASSKRLPPRPKSKPALGAKPTIEAKHSIEPQPAFKRRYPLRSQGSSGEWTWLGKGSVPKSNPVSKSKNASL